MDDEKKVIETGIDNKMELLWNDDTKISHRNNLWFLYRLLSEDIILSENLIVCHLRYIENEYD